MSTKMGGRTYQRAKAELKARGDAYCWRGCGTYLLADAPYRHPQHMTLGHYTAREDGGPLYDPHNYGPECAPCNSSDGARRTNNKRATATRDHLAQSYTDTAW